MGYFSSFGRLVSRLIWKARRFPDTCCRPALARGDNKPYSHASAYAAIPETTVIVVANCGSERLERFASRFGITNTYRDYREMIERERPDIVSVTAPSWARAEPIVFAAEHGVRGTYAERDCVPRLEEADQIVAACRANGVAFNWGAMRRHEVRQAGIRRSGESPTICTIRDLIRELEPGERTADNIDITMRSVEAPFGLAHSRLQGGARVQLPVADRRLSIPGG